jgi:putative membrane protein
MIVREKPGVLDILFALRGSILPRIATRLALITLVAAGAVVAAQRQPAFSRRSAPRPSR